jgi:nitrogen fixation-related uncharacterized protein
MTTFSVGIVVGVAIALFAICVAAIWFLVWSFKQSQKNQRGDD